MNDTRELVHEIATAYCEGVAGADLYRQASLVARFDLAISHLRARLVGVIETTGERELLCERKSTSQEWGAPCRSVLPRRIPSGNSEERSCRAPRKRAIYEAPDGNIIDLFVETLPHVEILLKIEQRLVEQRSSTLQQFLILLKTAVDAKKEQPQT